MDIAAPDALHPISTKYSLPSKKRSSREPGKWWDITSQVAKPGDYFTTELAGEPLLFVRGTDEKLRGFYNVCRHRAGPPAEGCGSRKLFRCGYHGWTYDLDGTLISATEIEGVEGFRPEDFALASVRTEEWFNLVFVNLDPQARPCSELWASCRRQADKFQFTKMKLFERRTYDMKCNWKTYVDNYLEGYHLPSVHPRTEPRTGLTMHMWSNPMPGTCGSSVPFAERSPAMQLLADIRKPARNLTTDYFWIFPNWMLNCYPDNVSLNIVLPLEPERSLAIFEWYLPEKDHGHLRRRRRLSSAIRFRWRMSAICEAVQKNLRSRSYSRGRFSVKQEKGVHAFHRMYADLMRHA